MGKQLTRLHYVSCPSCQTMFKPRVIPRKLTDTVHCICCAKSFTLEQTVPKNPRAEIKQASSAQTNSRRKLPVKVTKQNNTDSYLRKYKLKSKVMFLTWVAIPVVTTFLLTSLVYNNKDSLAQDVNLRPYLAQFCNLLDCELPTYRNLDYVLVEDNAMVSSSDQQNFIELFAMIKNIGKYDQQYPELNIKFTDINGKLITKKIVKPKDYLKNNSTGNPLYLAKNSKQYISMSFEDPGPDAINYEIALK